MKKAKVILTALSVFAVVGGALAFKAAKVNGTLFCTSTQNAVCDINQKYIPSSDPQAVNLFCTVTSAGQNGCTTVNSRTKVEIDE